MLAVAPKPARVRKPRAPRASTAKPKTAPAEPEPSEASTESISEADPLDSAGDLDL